MITILYPCGAYGSTLEYCIRRFSKEFTTVNCAVSETGNMHGFNKTLHITHSTQLGAIDDSLDIITPLYPMIDSESMYSIIDKFKIHELISHDKVIFVTLPTISLILLARLNSYYKQPKCSVTFFEVGAQNVNNWDPAYTTIDVMQVWEKREAVSLLDTNDAFMNAYTVANPNWLTISADNILYNLPMVVSDIITYLGLTFDDTGIGEFYKDWFSKQQYILDSNQLIETIVESTINNSIFKWDTLDFIVEALVQHKLRLHGYELQCYNLNQFPTDSTTLRKLLIYQN